MASGVLRVPAISDSRRRQGTTGQDYRRRELLMSRRVSAPPRQSSSPRFWMLRLRRMSQRERAKRSTSTASSTAASQRTAGSGIPLRAEALRAAERARITDRRLNGGYANPRIGHFNQPAPASEQGTFSRLRSTRLMRFDPILDFVAFGEIIDNPEIVWECCSCVAMTRHKSLVVFLRDCEVHGRTWHRPLRWGRMRVRPSPYLRNPDDLNEGRDSVMPRFPFRPACTLSNPPSTCGQAEFPTAVCCQWSASRGKESALFIRNP